MATGKQKFKKEWISKKQRLSGRVLNIFGLRSFKNLCGARESRKVKLELQHTVV